MSSNSNRLVSATGRGGRGRGRKSGWGALRVLVLLQLPASLPDSERGINRLASHVFVSQRTERMCYEVVGSFERVCYERMGVRLSIDAVMGDAEETQFNGLVGICGFEDSIYLMCFFHVLYNVRKRIQHLPEYLRVDMYRGVLEMHALHTQPRASHFGVEPHFEGVAVGRKTSGLQSVTIVSTSRVAIYATLEPSVARALYLGDRSEDLGAASDISTLADDVSVSNEPRGLLLSPNACKTRKKRRQQPLQVNFYRSAVKWSVRQAHRIGMPRDGWVVRIDSFECTCYYFKTILSFAHVIYGRAAFGLSVLIVNGYHLKFKDHRVRRKAQNALRGDQGTSSNLPQAQMTLLGGFPAISSTIIRLIHENAVLGEAGFLHDPRSGEMPVHG
ncbi:hypothetical protein GQ600_17792 [Phytophthora cactorum]|nr:hypothetical protein GQ600_17792 [Phytophthora cactorum]